jgi:Flp pilus assembly protein TadB
MYLLSQNVIILIVMVGFFAGLVVFSIKFTNIKEKRAIRKRYRRIQESKKKFQKIKEKHKSIRELNAEKYRLAKERSKAIRKEMKELENFNRDVLSRYE